MTMTEIKRPRGRPRPQATIERDEALLAHLKLNGPLSRNQLAESFGLDKTITYLALDRLRRAGLVRTCAETAGPSTLWSSDVEEPCP